MRTYSTVRGKSVPTRIVKSIVSQVAGVKQMEESDRSMSYDLL